MQPTRFSVSFLTFLPIWVFYASLRSTKPTDAFLEDEVQVDVEVCGMQPSGEEWMFSRWSTLFKLPWHQALGLLQVDVLCQNFWSMLWMKVTDSDGDQRWIVRWNVSGYVRYHVRCAHDWSWYSRVIPSQLISVFDDSPVPASWSANQWPSWSDGSNIRLALNIFVRWLSHFSLLKKFRVY